MDWGSIVFNHANLQSYALCQILREEFRLYPPAPARGWEWARPDDFDWRAWRRKPTADRAIAALNHPHCEAHMREPDGEWWQAVRRHCAERDGDDAVAAPLRREVEQKQAAAIANLHAAVSGHDRYTVAGMLRHSLLLKQ